MARKRTRWSPLELALAAAVVGAPGALAFLAAEWEGVALWVKWSALTLWLAAACWLAYLTLLQDTRVRSITEEARRWRSEHRAIAEKAIFDALLEGKRRFPAAWTLTAYLYNSDADRLEPIWPSRSADADWDRKCFRPGNGATGLAWHYEATIVKHGDEVHDATHGLTAGQQELFSRYNVVAATVIFDDAKQKIGVLTRVWRGEGCCEGVAVL